jgi:hypothetical protein
MIRHGRIAAAIKSLTSTTAIFFTSLPNLTDNSKFFSPVLPQSRRNDI